MKINKYSIIEPFLKKEKKLKDLSKEHDIPYSTLKRWIKAYKEKGNEGLDKKTRSDKNSFRKADDETLKYIKKEHKKNPNLNITTLYNNYLKKFKYKDAKKLSYNTVYRIASELDPFGRKHVKNNLKNLEEPNYIYRISTEKIYIENLGVHDNVATIIILYDVYDDSIINYQIYLEAPTVNHYLIFIKKSILKNKVDNFIVLPHSIIIDDFKITDKKRFHDILKNTNININGNSERNMEITRFINFLEKDIKNLFHHDKMSLESLNKDLEKYICNIVLRDVPKERKIYDFTILNHLLESVERKVQTNGVRFKNNLYKNDELKEYTGKTITLRYNFLDLSTLKVYLDDEFLFLLNKQSE